MMIAPNVTAIPSFNPALEAGAVAVMREISAEAAQVTNTAPYFMLENNNQPKQQVADKRPGFANQPQTEEVKEQEEDAILFGPSTLFLAQMFSQNSQNASYGGGGGGNKTLFQPVSAFDAMLFGAYSKMATKLNSDLPAPGTLFA